jgi:hypothetical protein
VGYQEHFEGIARYIQACSERTPPPRELWGGAAAEAPNRPGRAGIAELSHAQHMTAEAVGGRGLCSDAEHLRRPEADKLFGGGGPKAQFGGRVVAKRAGSERATY